MWFFVSFYRLKLWRFAKTKNNYVAHYKDTYMQYINIIRAVQNREKGVGCAIQSSAVRLAWRCWYYEISSQRVT